MSFTPDWLALREPLDHAARSDSLALGFAHALPAADPVRLADLGAGTGSNIRYLAPRLGRSRQHWRAIDRDGRLLDRLERAMREWAAPRGWTVAVRGDAVCLDRRGEAWRIDRVEADLASGPEVRAQEAVACAALLDLVSAAWLDALLAVEAPVLAALTYDGNLAWEPVDRLDRRMLDSFNRHQRRDKGCGAALGPTAAERLEIGARLRGRAALAERTPWHVRSGAMIGALIGGVAAAAGEEDPGAVGEIRDWSARRRSATVAVSVGHRDLLVLPPLSDARKRR